MHKYFDIHFDETLELGCIQGFHVELEMYSLVGTPPPLVGDINSLTVPEICRRLQNVNRLKYTKKRLHVQHRKFMPREVGMQVPC